MTQSSPSAEPTSEHLDGLMERALAGKLAEPELAQLKQHTQSCAACAALLEVGPTLAQKLADSQPDAARDQRLVARVLSPAVRSAAARRRRVVVALAAAALLLGSLAAAQYAGVLTLAPAPAQRADAAAPRLAPPQAPTQRAAATEPAPITDVQALPSEPKAAPAAPSAEQPAESASALFALANQLRRTGQDAPAIATYRKLQQAYPRSSEAALSHATLGSLLLQRGDAKGALPELDRYIASGGPVLEEALAGRARALGQLGQKSAEAQAWQKLLERFPASVHAARAHARLAELR